jgi:selenium metabolism protein YedF
MLQTIDTRGQTCPLPVMMTRDALQRDPQADFCVLVDNETARENVSRFARSQGCEVSTERQGEDIQIWIRPQEIAAVKTGPDQFGRVVLLVEKDYLGAAGDELGGILIRAYFRTIKDLAPLPQQMIFLHRGIFLTTTDSPVIDFLKEMEEKGVMILSCGTCLDYYQRKEKLEVGIVSNMLEIATALLKAEKLIKI